MNGPIGAGGWLIVLLLVLPIAALLARRVPLLKVVGQLAIWAMIFVVGLVVVGQRERISPYGSGSPDGFGSTTRASLARKSASAWRRTGISGRPSASPGSGGGC